MYQPLHSPPPYRAYSRCACNELTHPPPPYRAVQQSATSIRTLRLRLSPSMALLNWPPREQQAVKAAGQPRRPSITRSRPMRQRRFCSTLCSLSSSTPVPAGATGASSSVEVTTLMPSRIASTVAVSCPAWTRLSRTASTASSSKWKRIATAATLG